MSPAAPTVGLTTPTLGVVTIDTHDADALADGWAEQMGAEVLERNNGWYVILQGGTLPIRLSFQKVEDPTPGKNRIHLDVMAADLDDEVELLLGNGATLVARRRDESFRWGTLVDPHINESCVAARGGHRRALTGRCEPSHRLLTGGASIVSPWTHLSRRPTTPRPIRPSRPPRRAHPQSLHPRTIATASIGSVRSKYVNGFAAGV